MDREEIIRMAKECGAYPAANVDGALLFWSESQLERFAALVAATEREACATVCEEVESRAEELWDKFAYPEDQGMASGARQCTTAIRARRQE